MPFENWGHKCRYVFVDIHTRTIVVVKGSVPPSNISELKELRAQKRDYTGIISPQKLQTRTVKGGVSPNLTSMYDYAVIISGGGNKHSNWIRYWNDCAVIYSTLVREYAYPKDHIFVLMADGTDPEADRRLYNNTFDSSPLDLDGDGNPDIQYAATRENISKVFDHLGKTLTSNDNLFIYTMDHGDTINKSRKEVSLILWNEKITDHEFAKEVDKVHAGTINICMGQCFSGGFIDDLQGKNRVISTACTYNEVSKSMRDGRFDEFVYHWTAAVTGRKPASLELVNADSNYDGKVSMHEAFEYAKRNDRARETPQYSSTPTSLGHYSYLSQFYTFEISGDEIFCDSAVYSIDKLPKDYTVKWEYPFNHPPYPMVQSGYPSYNTCMIRNKYNYPYEGPLTAKVYHNSELITTLTKHVIAGTRYSYGTYMQESCSRPGIPESSLKEHEAYFVEPLCRVILQSYCFKAKGKITYDGITPMSTTLTDGQITFVLPAQTSGMPFNLYYHGGACKPYHFLFFTKTSYHRLRAVSSDNTLDISLIAEEQAGESSIPLRSIKKSKSWTVEVYYSATGDRVASKTINGRSQCSIDMSGWRRGTYIIRVVDGNDILTKKIVKASD